MLNFNVKILKTIYIFALMAKFLLLANNFLIHHEAENPSITISVYITEKEKGLMDDGFD